MAAPRRRKDPDLSRRAPLADLFERPRRFSFFQAVRLLERAAGALGRDPRVRAPKPVGEDHDPRQEAVHFRSAVQLNFPATEILGIEPPESETEGGQPIGRAALTVGFMGLTAIALWTAPRLFVHIYLADDADNARTIALAVRYLAVAAAFQLFDGAQVVGAGVLRGLQDTRVPMIIAALGYWVAGFGTAILLGFTFGLAGVGIWIGLAAGLAVVAILLLGRWHLRARFGLLPQPVHA